MSNFIKFRIHNGFFFLLGIFCDNDIEFPKSKNTTKKSKKKENEAPTIKTPLNEMFLELENFVEDSNRPQQENNENNAFVKFTSSRGEELFMRKSSCIWAWERDKTKVSTDRIYRFTNNKKQILEHGVKYISVGEFACFVKDCEVIIGHVLGFVYLTGKRTEYSLPYCPLNPNIPPAQRRGIAVLCSQYLVGDKILIPKNHTDYIDINLYVMHVSVEKHGNELILSEECYNVVSSHF